MDIDSWAKKIYQQNKEVGWWDDPNRCIPTTMMLMITEVSEATEGERKDLMDDHIPHRKMGEVELADALIRVLDVGGRFGLKFKESCDANFLLPSQTIGGKHLCICSDIIYFSKVFKKWSLMTRSSTSHSINYVSQAYSVVIKSILYVGKSQGYDIEEAMIEKIEYNKHRADHKRENREKEGGKKF